jgi:periplasmic divalent cation tolerance protein
MKKLIVLMTAPNEEAVKIASALVEERLAACVNIIKDIRSIYRWEGKVEDDSEALMVAKTTEELFGRLSTRVKELHPYSVPEVIAAPVVQGLKEYVEWIEEVTG